MSRMRKDELVDGDPEGQRPGDPEGAYPMTQVDAAVFDVDGTLVDTNYQHALSWYRAFRRFDIVLPVWRLHRAIGMGGDNLVAHVASQGDAPSSSTRRSHSPNDGACGSAMRCSLANWIEPRLYYEAYAQNFDLPFVDLLRRTARSSAALRRRRRHLRAPPDNAVAAPRRPPGDRNRRARPGNLAVRAPALGHGHRVRRRLEVRHHLRDSDGIRRCAVAPRRVLSWPS